MQKASSEQIIPQSQILETNEHAQVFTSVQSSIQSTLSPLSILDGLDIEYDGSILDSSSQKIIGKIVKDDVKKFVIMNYFCDDKGNVINYTGKTVRKVVTVMPVDEKEKVEKEKPHLGAPTDIDQLLEGLLKAQDTSVAVDKDSTTSA